ncbi:putative pectinesterase 63 [Tasmannia lanceolata]|uniref:putative pectinesterase 63 n=1 Tax=Tasmannia lanceolata TaxID=3420 RepID=UPI0040628D2E
MARNLTQATVLSILVTFNLGFHLVCSSHVSIPANSADLDRWFSETLSETAGLEPRLVAAEKGKKIITVNKDGTGDFKTVTDAVNSIPSGNKRRTIIMIGPGVYTEKVIVDRWKPFITFYGNPDAMPTISWGDTAANSGGTFYSATVGIDSTHFIAVNIIFENTAPMPIVGVPDGQAVALRIAGDKAAFYNCRFLGFQDTLLDQLGKHFFKDCYIKGTVDFVFGNGRSIYLNCVLHSVAEGVTAITAQGRTSVADKSGFSFVHCNITGSGKSYLSRAWMPSSRVVFAYSYLDTVVHPGGWDDKGFLDRDRTVFYGEYECKGPGASTKDRVSFGKLLKERQVQPFLSMSYIQANKWLLPPPMLNK